jgi:hypothetical protein
MIREHTHLLEDFPGIVGQLRAAIDLEASARAHGAFVRPRKITSVEELLRLALVYGCGNSLRVTSGFADAAGIADVSAPGIFERLSNCGDWLEAVALSLLREAAPQVSGAFRGKRLLAVDTTSISHPGAASASFRLHLRFDLSGGIEGLELSGGSGGERLSRFAWGEDDIVLADRGLARAPELEKLLAAGAGFILRSGWNAFKWLDNRGAPLDILGLIEGAGDKASGHEVRIKVKPKGEAQRSFPVRLVVVPLPQDKVEAARKKARKTARKNGKTIDPRTLAAAGYTLIVTTLPESFTPEAIAAFYRLRWQIELLFKRLKSLAGLGQLPAEDPGLAKTWIFAKLIIAILAETAAQKLADSSPSGASRSLSRKAGLGHRPLLPRSHRQCHHGPAEAHGMPASQAAA